MYLTGILVVTLCASVLGAGPQPTPLGKTQGPSTAQPQGMLEYPTIPHGSELTPPLQLSRFCFLGDTPSATCRFRCHLMNMDPFCMEPVDPNDQTGEDKCACKPREAAVPESSEETDNIFLKPQTHKEQEAAKNTKAGEKTESKPSTTSFTIPMHTALQESEEEQPKHHVVFYIFDLNKVFGPQAPEGKPEVPKPEVPQPKTAAAGWTVQHYIALLIILLLLVLITIEVAACYKKQRAKNNDMETIFKNIPMPNKA